MVRWSHPLLHLQQILISFGSYGVHLAFHRLFVRRTNFLIFAVLCLCTCIASRRLIHITQTPSHEFTLGHTHTNRYGVLDRESWQSVNKPSTAVLSALENELSSFGLDFCVWAYRNRNHPLDKHTFICEMLHRLKTYPKTLLICGDQDVLVHSSRAAEKEFRKHGFECHLSVYKARHAFVGLPPALNLGDEWKRHSLPATNEIKACLSTLTLGKQSCVVDCKIGDCVVSPPAKRKDVDVAGEIKKVVLDTTNTTNKKKKEEEKKKKNRRSKKKKRKKET